MTIGDFIRFYKNINLFKLDRDEIKLTIFFWFKISFSCVPNCMWDDWPSVEGIELINVFLSEVVEPVSGRFEDKTLELIFSKIINGYDKFHS